MATLSLVSTSFKTLIGTPCPGVLITDIGTYYEVYDDDVLVGFVGYVSAFFDTVFLQICVYPPYQGKGYGAKFIDALIVKEPQLKVLYATLLFDNVPSKKMLLKYGFKLVPEEETTHLRHAKKLTKDQCRMVYYI